MIEVYQQSHAEVAALRDSLNTALDTLRDKVYTNDKEQAVINARMSDAIAVNTTNITDLKSTLDSITQVKVPNSAVCPGWGSVSISPINWPIGTTIA